MGTLLDKPVTDKATERETGPDGLEFGVSAMQGWRIDMEDAHTIVTNVEGLKGHSFVAVYDGHGGDSCALYAGEHMMQHIKDTPQFSKYMELVEKDTKLLEDALHEAFIAADRGVKVAQDSCKDGDRSGCTAVVAFVTPTHLVLAHAGDSRAVLASGNKVAASTRDHKPYNIEEKTRIENAGGVVSMKRVDGDLAVSRALGDFQYKDEDLPPERCKVSAVPETRSIPRSLSEDEFLVVACDGIWDVMTDEECTQAIRQLFLDGETDVGLVCEEILDLCLRQGSRDNMSTVLVTFPGLKKASQGSKGSGVEERRRQRTVDGSEDGTSDNLTTQEEEMAKSFSQVAVVEDTPST